MLFTMYNNSHRDVVDECNPLVYGSIAKKSGNTGSIRLMKHKNTTSILYKLDSHTKYSIAVNTADSLIYSKNSHFGWLSFH